EEAQPVEHGGPELGVLREVGRELGEDGAHRLVVLTRGEQLPLLGGDVVHGDPGPPQVGDPGGDGDDGALGHAAGGALGAQHRDVAYGQLLGAVGGDAGQDVAHPRVGDALGQRRAVVGDVLGGD